MKMSFCDNKTFKTLNWSEYFLKININYKSQKDILQRTELNNILVISYLNCSLRHNDSKSLDDSKSTNSKSNSECSCAVNLGFPTK